ncbi:hypothetical protein [Actinomyces lilanjuaniae]|uniref:hypothetical protein n=1 Tax=Actinomyces lilanjuaniae TaxID=2321394 RepID=UPI001FAAD8CD|nr:hypothetical protein [Actinomyces lilanjuaniae]
MDSRDDILARVRGCYGAVRMRDLRLDRTERRQVARLVEANDLLSHPHGVIAVPGTEKAILLARIHGGVVTCRTAARYYGYPTTGPEQPIHIAVPDKRRFAPVRREVLHVERALTPPSPTSFPVAPVDLALARFLRCHPSAEAPLMACDAALHEEDTTSSAIKALLHGPGSARARERLSLASPRSRSPLETLARLQLCRVGVAFEDGVVVPGVGEVDIVVEGWLVLELDGYAYHASEYRFGLDRRRDRELVRRGFGVARFTGKDVRQGKVAQEVPGLLLSRQRHQDEVSKAATNGSAAPRAGHQKAPITRFS